jgi:ABC-type transport system involved in cytochrome c biogenesis permease subunit
MSWFNRLFPWLIGVLAVVMVGSRFLPPQHGTSFDLEGFAAVPVVANGRTKPADSFARHTLMVLSDRQTFYEEHAPTEGAGEPAYVRRPAVHWLLDAMSYGFGDASTTEQRVFRIDNPQVLDMLGLEKRLEPSQHKFRYAFAELEPHLPRIAQQAQEASEVEAKHRSLFQTQIIELARQLQLYVPILRWRAPLTVPSAEGAAEQWQPMMEAVHAARQGEPNPNLQHLARAVDAWQQGDAETFNARIAAYHSRLQSTMPDVVSSANVEVLFNRVAPMYQSMLLYIGVFLLVCIGWMGWRPALTAGLVLAVVALIVQTGGLGTRIYLQGRPPVTNLYSSAIFVGWVAVILGILLEFLQRRGFALAMTAVVGFATLLIAHHLGDSGDTMEMMQAVLDTNFWLATHVTTVSMGYSATFVAGLLAIIFILAGLLSNALDKPTWRYLGGMIYGTLCFALLFSFVGTVLGGIWADQSWGRFWGWDPKENGALLIVIWNALILHARWGGMVQQRGVAVLAVFGNVVTAWSWFGVNMLGVGLHSYGFMGSALHWLYAFAFSQLAIMAIGLTPLRFWKSVQAWPERRPNRGDEPGQPALAGPVGS